MRKLIIDTDTGSDDAVALLMALRSFGALSPFRIPFQLL